MGSYKSLIGSVLVLAALLQCAAAATTHVVGGSVGWTVSPTYSSWAADQTFIVGDTLVFNFTTGSHNVAQVSETDYNACTGTNPISTTTTGPANIVLSSTGNHYYICTITGHCQAGQKVTINVVSSDANSPLSSPPEAGGPPSSQSSASSLAVGFRVAGLVLVSAISFFF
ncbi:mavicyanin-like [Tasmannia lanceolata]|uniref:mavicyanin-like n=1 Tax=Tasmannia lanceolata TaxID=3420 RepID=UPI00406441C6